MLARKRERLALLLDLAEQPRVLDRQHRLACEGLHELDRALWEFANGLLLDRENAEHAVGRDQRHDQHRTEPGPHHEIAQRQMRRRLEVG